MEYYQECQFDQTDLLRVATIQPYQGIFRNLNHTVTNICGLYYKLLNTCTLLQKYYLGFWTKPSKLVTLFVSLHQQ